MASTTVDPQAGPRARSVRGRPPRISRQVIVEAAVELGIDSFTMVGIARQLGVQSPSLYSHVTGRDEVRALASVAVREHLRTFESDATGWRAWLEDFALLVRCHLTPSAASVMVDLRGPGTVDQVGLAEQGLKLLIAEGLSPAEAGYVVWLVFRVAVTAGREDTASFAGFVDDTGAALAPGFDAGMPATRAVHAALDGPRPHDTFSFDLELVLDGLAHRLDAAAQATGAAPPSPTTAPAPSTHPRETNS